MPDALPVSPDVIPEDHPDAAQLQAAPAVSIPAIFQPSPAAAPVTQKSVTSPSVMPDVIPEDSPEAAKLSAAPADAAPPSVIEEGSPAAAQLKTHFESLSTLTRPQIVQQYIADKRAGRATDSKDYEEAYAARLKGGVFADSNSEAADTPEGPGILKSVFDMGTSMLAGGATQANSIMGVLTGGDVMAGKPFRPHMMTTAEYQQNAAELKAGAETAFLNGAGMIRQFAVNIANKFTREVGTEDDKAAFKDQFHFDVDLQEAKERVAKGGSVFERPGAFGILSDADRVDPKTAENISQSPLADPSIFVPGLVAAKGAQEVGAIGKAMTVVQAGEDLNRASLAARSIAKTAETVSAGLKKSTSVFGNTPSVLKAAAAATVTHLAGGDAAFSTLMGFLAAGEKTTSTVAKTAAALDEAAAALRASAPGPMSKFAVAAYKQLTPEAKQLAISQAYNLPFALGGQTHDDIVHGIETGVIAHGLFGLPNRVNNLSPTLTMWHEAARAPGERAAVKDYGVDPLLDGMHRDVVKIANNEGNNLIQAARNMLSRMGSKGELYLGRPEEISRNLQDMASRGIKFLDPETGKPIEMTPDVAKFWADQSGVSFQVEMPPETPAAVQPAQPPVKRSIALVPFSERAPALSVGHELWHVVENTVLSPEERQHFEDETIRIYGPNGIAQARAHYAKLLGIKDPSTLKDRRVASELMGETFSGRLNAIPVGSFGPGGEMTFKNPAYRKYVRNTAAMIEKVLRKVGADVPEVTVPTTVTDSQGNPYTHMLPGTKGVRSGLGWELSSELGNVVDNFLESKRLDSAVSEEQGHVDPFTEEHTGPTADNPIQNVREIAPEPAFKKGDPIGEVTDGDGNVVAKSAIVSKVIPDAKGDHQYEIEYTDPADGKRKAGVVPEKFLQSPVKEGAGPVGEATPAQRGIESVAKPKPSADSAANTPAIPAKPAAKENARQVTPEQRARILGGPLVPEPQLATPEVIAHNTGVIGEEVAKPAAEQRLLTTDYYSASEGRASDTGPVREARRNLVEQADPKTTKGLRALYEKLIHVYKYTPNPGNGRPFVTAFSFDNFIRNLDLVDGWLRSKGLKNDPALARMKSPDFGQAVQNYWRNQANGYRGDGERLVRPADLKPETIPAENADYTPVPVSKHDVEIINLAMGIELPKNSSVATRFAAKMAKENGVAPTLNEAGVEITNPFTADLIAKGFDPNILHSTVQQLSVDKMTTKLVPSEYKGTSRAVLATVRAGFMPRTEPGLAEAPEPKRLFLPTRGKALEQTPKMDDTSFAVKPLEPKKLETGFRRGVANIEDHGVFMPREHGNEETRKVAAGYMHSIGNAQEQHDRLAPIDPEFAKRIADFYDEAKDSPHAPEVKAAYNALADETMAQYAAMKKAGITIEPFEGNTEPYKDSAAMRADVGDAFLPFSAEQIKPSSPDGKFMPRSTPAQEKALKDSKVRGPDGKLLPLFHGTYSDFKHFKTGDLGFHFGTPEAANARIGKALSSETDAGGESFDAYREVWEDLPPSGRAMLETLADGARTLPVFLDIKNPLRMRDVGPWDQPDQVWSDLPQKLQTKLPTASKAIDRYTELRDSAPNGDTDRPPIVKALKDAQTAIREGLKSLGYDGVVYHNEFEAPLGADRNDSYIAFDNKQIVPAYAADAKARFMPRDKVAVPGADELQDVRDTRSFKEMVKHLTPEEADGLRSDTAESMVDLWKDLPPDSEFEAAVHAGLIKKGWYARAAQTLQTIFGPDAERFVGLLAATSPRQSVQENLQMALNIWADWQDAGRPLDAENLTPIVKKYAELHARVPNSIAALQGHEPDLSGNKVEAFRKNLLGDMSVSTNDTWMALFGNLDQAKFGTKSGHLAFTAKVRKVAKKLDMHPAEVQETVWSFFKTLVEGTTVKRDAKETLRSLSDSDILNTPEFHDEIVTNPKVRAQLERLGFVGFDQVRDRANSQRPTGRLGSLVEIAEREGGPGRLRVLDRIANRAQRLKEAEVAPDTEENPY